MKKTFLLLLFLSFTLVAISQQPKTVKGYLYDSSSNEPIAYATVVQRTIDSTYVAACITDSLGCFKLKVNPERYLLCLGHLQYQDTIINVGPQFTNPLRFKLTVDQNLLNEVVVTASKTLSVRNGALIYNAPELAKNKPVNNAREMLTYIPGITSMSGKLALIGTSNLTILINGKPNRMSSDQLMTYLSQLPPSDIKNIEVMYDAPAKYHTKGAVVNIITKKRTTEKGTHKWEGQVNGEASVKHYFGYNGGGSLRFTKSDFSMGVYYNFKRAKEYEELDIDSYHVIDEKMNEIHQQGNTTSKESAHSVNVDLNYAKGKSNYSLVYNMQASPDGHSDLSTINNLFNSNSTTGTNSLLHSVMLDYSYDTDFKVGAYYTFYRKKSDNYFKSHAAQDDREFTSDAKQNLNIVGGYIDNNHKFDNGWSFGYGATARYTRDKDYQYYKVVEGDKLKDTDSEVNEFIGSGYLSTEKHFDNNLTLKASLTAEYSDFGGKHYFNIFPQVSCTYMPSRNNLYMLTFSSNKSYPSYWERQDYVSYMDAYSKVCGNPNLKSFDTYTLNLRYIYKQKYIFGLYHINQPDFFQQSAYQSSEKLELIYQTLNWDYNRKTGANIILPFNIGDILDSRFIVDSYYQHSRCKKFYDISFNHHTWCNTFVSDNTIMLSKKRNLALNIVGFYALNPIQGPYDLADVYDLNLALKWSFWNNNGSLTLKGSELLINSYDIDVNYANQNFGFSAFKHQRAVTLSFSYNFGSFKKRELKKVDTSRFK